jgi:hypothetical protein
MPIQHVQKIEAATAQFEAAAASYLRGEFIPAITLAAAAEKIFARFLPADKQSSQDELIAKFGEVGIPAKDARDIYLNATRNALKHHNETENPYIEFDPETDARVWLARALHNCGKLGIKFPPSVAKFLRAYDPRRQK